MHDCWVVFGDASTVSSFSVVPMTHVLCSPMKALTHSVNFESAVRGTTIQSV